jgi:hypothetical protein
VYITKPHDTIGTFSLYRFGVYPDAILCSDTVPSFGTPGMDNLYIFITKSSSTWLLQTQEFSNYVSVLTLDNFPVYTKNEILIDKQEYVQTWVFNKAFNKLILNNLRLKDKIKGRFTGVYDSQNNPLLSGTLYFLLNDLDLTAYQITPDHFVGNNEALSSVVINRCLQKIYNLQVSMISKSNTIIQSSSFFQNQAVSIV